MCVACTAEVSETLPAESLSARTPAASAQLSPSQVAATFEPGVGNGWGPLAVAHDEGRSFALTGGTLRITETCTYLLGPDGGVSYLVVWRATDTIWDGERRRIIFRNPEYRDPPSQIFALADGQHVQLGGGAAPFVTPIATSPRWASVPHPECMAPEFWYVGEIVP
jgi:hypothetical protein